LAGGEPEKEEEGERPDDAVPGEQISGETIDSVVIEPAKKTTRKRTR